MQWFSILFHHKIHQNDWSKMIFFVHWVSISSTKYHFIVKIIKRIRYIDWSAQRNIYIKKNTLKFAQNIFKQEYKTQRETKTLFTSWQRKTWMWCVKVNTLRQNYSIEYCMDGIDKVYESIFYLFCKVFDDLWSFIKALTLPLSLSHSFCVLNETTLMYDFQNVYVFNMLFEY